MVNVSREASSIKFAEHKTPIEAVHQSVAAVVSPLTLCSSFIITPAHKKSIPATIYAAILVVSKFENEKENLQKKNEPKLTSTIVLRPMILLQYCLSTPIQKLKNNILINLI